MKLADIHANSDNPRTIKDERFKKLLSSIKDFPKMMELRPIVVDKEGKVLGGNMRYKALIELGYTEIPDSWVKVANELTEKEKRRFIIEDNLPFGEWDWDKLSKDFEVGELLEWGFDEKDLKIEQEVEEDEAPEVSDEPAISKLGEVYQLGRHRLMCGDSTKIEDVEKLMNGQKADMVFTDPPYLMGFEGNVHADGSKSFNAKYGDIKNDNLSEEEGKQFLLDTLSVIVAYTKGAFYICWYRLGIDKLMEALKSLKLRYKAVIIWDKGNHTLSNSDYMSRYEPIVYGWVKEHNFYGKPAFDLWKIDRTRINDQHPTMKPVELCANAIKNSSKPDEIVLDLFGGSGSTLIACEQTNRTCYMMEISEAYCDTIRRRYWKFTHNNNEDGWKEGTPIIS